VVSYFHEKYPSPGPTLEVHGSPKANFVPALQHSRFEIQIMNGLLRLGDYESASLRMDRACNTAVREYPQRGNIKTYWDHTIRNRSCLAIRGTLALI
jgi:hypothetical protein